MIPEKDIARLLEDFERPCDKNEKRKRLWAAAIVSLAVVIGFTIGICL